MSVQPKAKAHAFRSGEAIRRVTDLQGTSPAGRKADGAIETKTATNRPVSKDRLAVGDHLFDDQRWQVLIVLDLLWINDNHSFDRGEPEPAVASLPAGWLKTAT